MFEQLKNQDRDLGSQLESATFVLILACIFLTPLFFLPILASSFDLSKQVLLFVLTGLAAVIYTIKLTLSTKTTIIRSVFDRPLIAFVTVTIIATLLSVNKFVSLASDPVIYISVLILFLLLTQTINKEKQLRQILKAFFYSGAILGVWSTIQFIFPFVSSKVTVPALLAPYLNSNFNPTGSTLSMVIFLAILLPVCFALYYETKIKKESVNSILYPLVLISVGLITGLAALFKNHPLILPFEEGWKIATGTIGQSLASAFFGVGPGHFVDSFTLHKSVDFNNSVLWNLRFIASSNFYFYILTTTGIVGFAALIWLIVQIIKTSKKRLDTNLTSFVEKGLITSLFVGVVMMAILPTPQIGLLAIFTFLGLFIALLRLSGNTKYVFEESENFDTSSWQKPALLILSLAIFLGGSYFLGSVALADFHFAKSIKAAAQNQGTQTYNEQIAAMKLNPWNDNYRVSYSQTNLALGNALASQPNLSDQQKQTVLTLVQQSIREARNAVALEPRRASAWENLSLIYKSLINFAQGADQFAISSQNQAINFDPSNPRLRLDLGGIYFSLKDYQSAGQAFSQAVSLKSDYANAHYNLAQAAKELKLKDQALQQLQLTANLICSNNQNADCQKINEEIATLGDTQSPSLATTSASAGLPNIKTQPPVKVSSPGGELTQ